MSDFDHEGDFKIEGQLGVGTFEPNAELDINSGDSEFGAKINLSSENNESFLKICAGGNMEETKFIWKHGKPLKFINTDDLNGIDSELFTITSEGRVGIGVNEPESTLEVDGNIKALGIDAGEILKNGEPIQLSLWRETSAGIKHDGTVEAGSIKSDSVETRTIDVKEILQNGKPLKTSPWIKKSGHLEYEGKVKAQNIVTDGEVKTKIVNANEYKINGKPLETTPWKKTTSGIKHEGTVEAAKIKSGVIDVGQIIQNGKPLVTSPWINKSGNLEYGGKVKAQNIVTDGEVKTKSINSGQYLQNGKPLLTSNWDKISSGINYSKGKVGIGNKNPKANLDVNGLIKSGSLITNNMTVGNGITFSNIQAGRAVVGRNNSRIKRNFRVKFPKAFKSIPIVMATAKGLSHPDTYALTTTLVNKNEFRINILRTDAAVGWAQNLQLDWIALELAPVKFQSIIGVMGTTKISANKKKAAKRVRRGLLR